MSNISLVTCEGDLVCCDFEDEAVGIVPEPCRIAEVFREFSARKTEEISSREIAVQLVADSAGMCLLRAVRYANLEFCAEVCAEC